MAAFRRAIHDAGGAVRYMEDGGPCWGDHNSFADRANKERDVVTVIGGWAVFRKVNELPGEDVLGFHNVHSVPEALLLSVWESQ